MADQPPLVVVTGLTALGKTTVAVPLAQALGVPLVSKDAIKEALFEAVGIGDLQWSNTLSRAADAALVEIASRLDAAVLDNSRPDRRPDRRGLLPGRSDGCAVALRGASPASRSC